MRYRLKLLLDGDTVPVLQYWDAHAEEWVTMETAEWWDASAPVPL